MINDAKIHDACSEIHCFLGFVCNSCLQCPPEHMIRHVPRTHKNLCDRISFICVERTIHNIVSFKYVLEGTRLFMIVCPSGMSWEPDQVYTGIDRACDANFDREIDLQMAWAFRPQFPGTLSATTPSIWVRACHRQRVNRTQPKLCLRMDIRNIEPGRFGRAEKYNLEHMLT